MDEFKLLKEQNAELRKINTTIISENTALRDKIKSLMPNFRYNSSILNNMSSSGKRKVSTVEGRAAKPKFDDASAESMCIEEQIQNEEPIQNEETSSNSALPWKLNSGKSLK